MTTWPTGGTLDFLSETKAVREDDSWKVADPAPALMDRRAEITGPTDAKMAINALNSGAKVWLADHEDANTPLWENMVRGQINLREAIEGSLEFSSPEGKQYSLRETTATIVLRPRGCHLPEKHLLVDGERTSGSLFDFGLYFVTVWLEIVFGSVILLSGVTQPIVLLVIAASLNGLVMFVYSILLIQLNRRVLPREIGLKGGRLVAKALFG